jgi:hypothetical protein
MRRNEVEKVAFFGGIKGAPGGAFGGALGLSRCHFSGVYPHFSPQSYTTLLIINELQIFPAH